MKVLQFSGRALEQFQKKQKRFFHTKLQGSRIWGGRIRDRFIASINAGAPSRLAFMLACAVLAAGVAACADKEARQRETFIAFLQSDVLEPGPVSVPKLDPEQARDMGDYAKHYTIITDFHDALNERVQKPGSRCAKNDSRRASSCSLATRSSAKSS